MSKRDQLIIGIDFDNTIISYDKVLFRVAFEQGFIHHQTEPRKTAIRDSLRRLPGGELKWQELQAQIYGPLIQKAELVPGVHSFLSYCRDRSVPAYIVSHKTRYAAAGADQIDLRSAALNWMRQNDVLNAGGLSRAHIFFEPDRSAKINRICDLHCTHFIDDLIELFRDAAFPPRVKKIWYNPHMETHCLDDIESEASWNGIFARIFN